MAEVFKAKSFGVEGFEKVLVIKRILPALAESKAFVDMFVHEAKLAVRLSHANVVQVFDLGRVDRSGEPPSYFMAMEYVAGLDLATVLGRCRQAKRALPLGMAIFIAAEVAKGLDHAHRRRDEQGQPLGIVHRDVSPQNILLSWEGEVKVTDFGIAKARDNLDQRPDESTVRQLKGKHAYMSPEQARSEPVDARSDIFSLGVALYEMLAGVNPFRAPTPFETLRRVQACEFPPLELLRDDVPKSLGSLVARALAKHPSERFPDAARAYEELLAYLYQSSARFGAADLAEFLAAVREAETDDARAGESPANKLREETPVERPSSSSGLRSADPPTPSRPPIASAQWREASAMVLSMRTAGGPPEESARKAACELVARYGGVLLDGSSPFELATLFGLEGSDGRDSEHAARCARLAVRRLTAAGVTASAGVHVGRVLVGRDGAAVQDEHVSALLSQAQELARAADGRVAASPQTARSLRGLFAFEPLRGDAMVIGDERAAHETYGRFVGRREELGRIGRLMAAASKRKLQVVTLVGPEGVGKTRLLHEVGRRLSKGEFNVGFYVAACPPGGEAAPLSAITAMLHALCGVPAESPPERVRAVEPSLRALGLLDEEVSAVLAQLGLADTSRAGTHALRNAFSKALMRLAEDRVHAFAWDDAHAIDEASLEVLRLTAKRLPHARLTFLFAGRSDLAVPIATLGAREEVVLDVLPREDAERLLALRIGASELPPELSTFCTRLAGGHPLFLEELARDLLDARAVVVDGGTVRSITLDGELAVPRPLRAIIAGRVARLAPELLATLQLAAVVGEPIADDVLEGLADGGSASLDALEERGLLLRAPKSTRAFASPLLHDIILHGTPGDARRELHARIAAALEQTAAPRLDDHEARIAAHWAEAGERGRAASLYARSGARRLASRHFDSAADAALRALDLGARASLPVDEIVTILPTLSAALERTRIGRRAPDVLARALAYVETEGTPEHQIAARMEIASAYGAISLLDRALETLAPAHALASDGPLAARVWLVEAQLHALRGDFARVLTSVVRAEAGPLEPHLVGRALKLRAQSHGALGERDAAFAYLDQAAKALGDAFPEVERHKVRALTHYFVGDFAGTVTASVQATELAKAAGLTFEVAVNLHNMGDAFIRLGDNPHAYAVLSESLSACEQCGADRLASQNRVFLGYLDAVKGVPGGETQLRSGIAHAEERGYAWDVVNGRFLLGLLLEHDGHYAAACAELDACARHAEELQNRLIALDCRAALDRCERARADQRAT